MRILITTLLVMLTTQLLAQRGYVKLENDSILNGFIRYYKSDGHEGYEIWKTKTDKNPRKIPIQRIYEFAVKGDTFKILRQFKPFPDDRLYFKMVDAKIESRGKVNLYSIDSYRRSYMLPLSSAQLPSNDYQYIEETIYILEDGNNGLLALPRENDELEDILVDFFSEEYLRSYVEENG